MWTRLTIPEGLRFSSLALKWAPMTFRLLFNPATLAALCWCNGLDAALVLADEDLCCGLIFDWYFIHRTGGGEPDAIVEELLDGVAEQEAEQRRFNNKMVD